MSHSKPKSAFHSSACRMEAMHFLTLLPLLLHVYSKLSVFQEMKSFNSTAKRWRCWVTYRSFHFHVKFKKCCWWYGLWTMIEITCYIRVCCFDNMNQLEWSDETFVYLCNNQFSSNELVRWTLKWTTAWPRSLPDCQLGASQSQSDRNLVKVIINLRPRRHLVC